MVKLVNRAKMTTATTGTGTITLGSAVDGYQTYAAAGVSDGDVVRYVIEDGNNWEIGTGTYTSSGTTLSRTVLESSNAGAAINLSGDAVVYVTAVAEDFLALDVGDNAIINGNFDIWQRGTSFTGSKYGADRWQNVVSGSTATQSQQTFTLGQTDVPGEPEYFARTVVSSVAGAGNYSFILQRIEGVRTFAGQTATLSFWAKADAAKNIAVEFEQFFGTGGSPSTPVNALGVTTLAITTSWQKFTVTVSLPSISGKVLGTDNNSQLIALFWFDAGSNFNARTNSLGQQSGTFDIARVKLEAGSVATPFRPRPVGEELALCQRYYWKGLPFQTFNMGAYSANIFQTMSFDFPVTMRANPTIQTDFSGATFSNGLTLVNVAAQTQHGSRILFQSTQITTNASVDFGASAFITADAEL
jgi:hypothetical protein